MTELNPFKINPVKSVLFSLFKSQTSGILKKKKVWVRFTVNSVISSCILLFMISFYILLTYQPSLKSSFVCLLPVLYGPWKPFTSYRVLSAPSEMKCSSRQSAPCIYYFSESNSMFLMTVMTLQLMQAACDL